VQQPVVREGGTAIGWSGLGSVGRNECLDRQGSTGGRMSGGYGRMVVVAGRPEDGGLPGRVAGG